MSGGAQQVLFHLLARQDRARFAPSVVTLLDGGHVRPAVEALGVPTRSLGLTRGVPNPLAVGRLAAWLRDEPADLVQTWMYHADLVGGLAAKAAGVPVVWGVHHTDLPPHATKRLTRWTARACAGLSAHVPAAIVCCSHATARVHAALGYAAGNLRVVPNGVDLDHFRPDPSAPAALRAELGLPAGTPLVGLMARFHPQKDHATFIAAAARLAARDEAVRFVLCGEDVDAGNAELTRAIAANGLGARVHLLGRRDDAARVTAGLDVATLSSAFGEGMPCTVLEAMACAVPCVATDVGDAAHVLGEVGRIIAPRDADALAAAWAGILTLGSGARAALGATARERVRTHFGLAETVAGYEGLHAALGRTPVGLVPRLAEPVT